MKLGRRILATVAAVVVAVVMTGCPSPLRPPPVEWVTVFDLSTDAAFQALPVGVPLTDEMLDGLPFDNNGAELMMVEHDGGRALRIVTPAINPEWRGINVLDSVLGFAVGDVITITGEVLSSEGQPHLSEDITAFVPLQGWNPVLSAGGPFSHEFDPLSSGEIVAIRSNTAWDNPPHLRFHVNRANSETLITGFTLSGNRPIGFEPPPPPPPPPPLPPLSVGLQHSADRFRAGDALPSGGEQRTAGFTVSTFGLTDSVIYFDGFGPGGWAGGPVVTIDTIGGFGTVDVSGRIVINQAGTGTGVLTLAPNNAVLAGFHPVTVAFGNEEVSSYLRIWPSSHGLIIGEERGELVDGVDTMLEVTVIGFLPGSGYIHFSNDNVTGLPPGIYASGIFDINGDGLGLGTLTLSGNAAEDGTFFPTVRLHGFETYFEVLIGGVLYSILEDEYVTYGSGSGIINASPWLNVSGGPTIEVERGEDEDGYWIAVTVSDRNNDWDTFDVILAGNITLVGEYAITITGVTTPGVDVRFQTIPNWGWQPEVTADENGEFELTRLFSFDGDEFATASHSGFSSFRIHLGEEAGPHHDFTIHSLEIYQAGSDDDD